MMKKQNQEVVVADEMIFHKIYFIRGQKVMLDRDLAKLYEVETKVLKQAVKRNQERFPDDFMFELAKDEDLASRSQIVTLNKRGMNTKYLPMAFTEQGVAMLSSVLKSKRAIQVNIQIMRLFTKLRSILADTTELRLEIDQINAELNSQGQNLEAIFKCLDELIAKREAPEPRIRIGYVPDRMV